MHELPQYVVFSLPWVFTSFSLQISSPADPALLYFKLNKLQQAQNSHSYSASVSPQPSLLSSNNPMSPSPILQPPPPAAASSAPLRHGHSLSLAAAPFVPSRPYMAFNANMPYNPFGSNPPLPSDSIRSPDTRSDPGAPTDQSLAPPPMPVRADSRPDFVRGFGLDVPDETEEELEQEEGQTEEDDQSVLEGYEEERVLAEASHIALAGTDDTMDMELDVDEADAEVGSITTAAQSRVHSRHVSRLSATLSLLSVGSHVSDTELRAARNVLGEREGDVEDVGEWTGSEDLRTTAETTEDEVRKILAALFTRVHASVSIYMITSPCFVFSLAPFVLSPPLSLAFLLLLNVRI